jgi:Asp-tRNA(Asn)/Glu-tRNA(Gln) amidotransferase A subunit family amidase
VLDEVQRVPAILDVVHALTSTGIARGEVLRTRLWHRVREFLAERDVWIMPTMAMPAFPVEHPHVMEIDGEPSARRCSARS